MNNRKVIQLAFGAALAASTTLLAGATGKEEAKMKDAWLKEHLAGVKSALPFSFTYAGQPSAKWLAEWSGEKESKRLDANRTRV